MVLLVAQGILINIGINYSINAMKKFVYKYHPIWRDHGAVVANKIKWKLFAE